MEFSEGTGVAAMRRFMNADYFEEQRIAEAGADFEDHVVGFQLEQVRHHRRT
jgi:hypothetical protein